MGENSAIIIAAITSIGILALVIMMNIIIEDIMNAPLEYPYCTIKACEKGAHTMCKYVSLQNDD